MKRAFNFTINTEFDTKSNYTNKLIANKKSIQNSLDIFLSNDNTLDGKKLVGEWFPEIRNCKVFISHSHKDTALAESFANWLNQHFQISSFLDSHVWGYSAELLKELYNENSEDTSSEFNYDKLAYYSSHVNLMLSNALNNMIDKTDFLFFLNTENSIEDVSLKDEQTDYRTDSPWIMSELYTSYLIWKNQSKMTVGMESEGTILEEILKIEHEAHTEHLTEINKKNLIDAKFSVLDKLSYKEYLARSPENDFINFLTSYTTDNL